MQTGRTSHQVAGELILAPCLLVPQRIEVAYHVRGALTVLEKEIFRELLKCEAPTRLMSAERQPDARVARVRSANQTGQSGLPVHNCCASTLIVPPSRVHLRLGLFVLLGPGSSHRLHLRSTRL